MFTDTITYEDFNGNETSQEVYFNISKMEAIGLETMYPGGYSKKLEEISKSEDAKEIFDTLKDFVDISYGVKSEDGKRFVKSDEELEKFKSSPAYDEFMLKLLGEEDYALNFTLGTFPKVEGITKEALLNETRKEKTVEVVHNN